MTKVKSELIRNQALEIFKNSGGILRTKEILAAGVHPRILYELCELGFIERIHRGLYALVNLPDINEPDLVIITKKVRNGVICLVSALYFHRLTVQIPKWIDIAVPQKYKTPLLKNPPLQFHWFSEGVFNSGIEKHNIGGIEIQVYSPEKSIIDCFRLRKKVGMDIALEALCIYLKQKKVNLKQLRKLAQESRVLRLIEPYLEALTYDQS